MIDEGLRRAEECLADGVIPLNLTASPSDGCLVNKSSPDGVLTALNFELLKNGLIKEVDVERPLKIEF